MPNAYDDAIAQVDKLLYRNHDISCKHLNEDRTNDIIDSNLFDRVGLSNAWIVRALGVRRSEGGLGVVPPVLSRCYQLLGDGHLFFMQCKKIRDTPFPFPYAQLMRCLLWILVLSVPFTMEQFFGETWPARVYASMVVLMFFSLNEVARELEVPFHYGHNDINVDEVHDHFMAFLDMLHANFKAPPREEDHQSLQDSIISLGTGAKEAQCKCPSCQESQKKQTGNYQVLEQSVYDVTQEINKHTDGELKRLWSQHKSNTLTVLDMHRLQTLHLKHVERQTRVLGISVCEPPQVVSSELQCLQIAATVRSMLTLHYEEVQNPQEEVLDLEGDNFIERVHNAVSVPVADLQHTQLVEASKAIDIWLLIEAKHLDEKGTWSPCESERVRAKDGHDHAHKDCPREDHSRWAIQGVLELEATHASLASGFISGSETYMQSIGVYRLKLWVFVLQRYRHALGKPLDQKEEAWLGHAELRVLQLSWTAENKKLLMNRSTTAKDQKVLIDNESVKKVSVVIEIAKAKLKLLKLQPLHVCNQLHSDCGGDGQQPTCFEVSVFESQVFSSRSDEMDWLERKVLQHRRDNKDGQQAPLTDDEDLQLDQLTLEKRITKNHQDSKGSEFTDLLRLLRRHSLSVLHTQAESADGEAAKKAKDQIRRLEVSYHVTRPLPLGAWASEFESVLSDRLAQMEFDNLVQSMEAGIVLDEFDSRDLQEHSYEQQKCDALQKVIQAEMDPSNRRLLEDERKHFRRNILRRKLDACTGEAPAEEGAVHRYLRLARLNLSREEHCELRDLLRELLAADRVAWGQRKYADRVASSLRDSGAVGEDDHDDLHPNLSDPSEANSRKDRDKAVILLEVLDLLVLTEDEVTGSEVDNANRLVYLRRQVMGEYMSIEDIHELQQLIAKNIIQNQSPFELFEGHKRLNSLLVDPSNHIDRRELKSTLVDMSKNAVDQSSMHVLASVAQVLDYQDTLDNTQRPQEAESYYEAVHAAGPTVKERQDSEQGVQVWNRVEQQTLKCVLDGISSRIASAGNKESKPELERFSKVCEIGIRKRKIEMLRFDMAYLQMPQKWAPELVGLEELSKLERDVLSKLEALEVETKANDKQKSQLSDRLNRHRSVGEAVVPLIVATTRRPSTTQPAELQPTREQNAADQPSLVSPGMWHAARDIAEAARGKSLAHASTLGPLLDEADDKSLQYQAEREQLTLRLQAVEESQRALLDAFCGEESGSQRDALEQHANFSGRDCSTWEELKQCDLDMRREYKMLELQRLEQIGVLLLSEDQKRHYDQLLFELLDAKKRELDKAQKDHQIAHQLAHLPQNTARAGPIKEYANALGALQLARLNFTEQDDSTYVRLRLQQFEAKFKTEGVKPKSAEYSMMSLHVLLNKKLAQLINSEPMKEADEAALEALLFDILSNKESQQMQKDCGDLGWCVDRVHFRVLARMLKGNQLKPEDTETRHIAVKLFSKLLYDHKYEQQLTDATNSDRKAVEIELRGSADAEDAITPMSSPLSGGLLRVVSSTCSPSHRTGDLTRRASGLTRKASGNNRSGVVGSDCSDFTRTPAVLGVLFRNLDKELMPMNAERTQFLWSLKPDSAVQSLCSLQTLCLIVDGLMPPSIDELRKIKCILLENINFPEVDCEPLIDLIPHELRQKLSDDVEMYFEREWPKSQDEALLSRLRAPSSAVTLDAADVAAKQRFLLWPWRRCFRRWTSKRLGAGLLSDVLLKYRMVRRWLRVLEGVAAALKAREEREALTIAKGGHAAGNGPQPPVVKVVDGMLDDLGPIVADNPNDLDSAGGLEFDHAISIVEAGSTGTPSGFVEGIDLQDFDKNSPDCTLDSDSTRGVDKEIEGMSNKLPIHDHDDVTAEFGIENKGL